MSLHSFAVLFRLLQKRFGYLPCPSIPWFLGFPWLILSKEFPWLFWYFLCLFQGFCGFGSERKSLVNLRFFLGETEKTRNGRTGWFQFLVPVSGSAFRHYAHSYHSGQAGFRVYPKHALAFMRHFGEAWRTLANPQHWYIQKNRGRKNQ